MKEEESGVSKEGGMEGAGFTEEHPLFARRVLKKAEAGSIALNLEESKRLLSFFRKDKTIVRKI